MESREHGFCTWWLCSSFPSIKTFLFRMRKEATERQEASKAYKSQEAGISKGCVVLPEDDMISSHREEEAVLSELPAVHVGSFGDKAPVSFHHLHAGEAFW